MKKLYLKNGNMLGMLNYYKNNNNQYYCLDKQFSLLAWIPQTTSEVGYTVKHTLPNDYFFKAEKVNSHSISVGFYTPQGVLIDGANIDSLHENNYTLAYLQFLEDSGKGHVYVYSTNDLEYGPSKAITSEHPVMVDWTSLSPSGIYPDTAYIDVNSFKIDFYNLPDMDWTKPDPYKNGGYSGENGGGGNFDETSNIIAKPELPTLTAQNTGFITIYSPLAGELQALSTYMWSDDFITSVKKLYANPADSLIMLAIVPIKIPSAVDSDVKIAGISTGLTMHKALSQYIEIDCGAIEINEFFGSCFDYQPYTQIQIYCPFSGYYNIDVDICMNTSLNLRYYFDILSGTFIAYLLINNTVMYQWAGQAITMLPTSSYNIDALIKGAVATTASVAGAVATGGALAPIAGAMTVASVTSMKPQVSHGGDITGSSALLSVREPHVIIKRPRQVLPQAYNEMSGYPSMINAVLSDLSGYTEIYSVHLSDMSCTDNEKIEIEKLLKEGVIL